MLLIHNILMALQWLGFLGGMIFGLVGIFLGSVDQVLASFSLAFLALIALKLEVLAFAR